MDKKPFGSWEFISEKIKSSTINYWQNNRVYDKLSAKHNGITGLGHTLKTMIKRRNNEKD